MKTLTNTPTGSVKPRLLIGGSLAIVVLSVFLVGGKSPGKYVAHEWGTFTSVQGGDGALLDWRPLETSRLPKFVYDWKHPGLNRQGGGLLALGKGGMVTLQRMETPVIYFYADERQMLDVQVDFPQGQITEWYPQASKIGPSSVPVPPAIARMDDYVHKAGVKPSFTFASLLRNKSVPESRARWANVEILPAKHHPDLTRSLPLDGSGSHYFSARDTGADYLRLDSLVATNPLPEYEKFIFYRGVGNFATPLRVTMNESKTATLANTGQEPLFDLFVLGLENRAGSFHHLARLAPGEERTVALEAKEGVLPLEKVSRQLGKHLAEALVRQGLYQREATAMVNTWKGSWFEEDGLRVLYILPRPWTDRTLPLTLDPAPRQLVRVMVGRAEVLTPAQMHKLSETLAKAKQGDAGAREQAVVDFKKLGRFAEPALRLAAKGLDGPAYQNAWTLLQAAAKPGKEDKPLGSGGAGG
jgi:hypothetical protein